MLQWGQAVIELTAFRYRYKTSILHGLDVRFKLIMLVMISCVSLQAQGPGLLGLTFMLLALMINAGQTVTSLRTLFRHMFIFLALIFIARALTTPGVPVIEYKTVMITREGIHDGTIVCWRLLIVVMIGLLLVATTLTSEIKAAVEWFLRPVPFVPAKRVAVMMSLIMRFIPVVLDQAKETLDAQRARAVENRKNPVYRLRKLLIPLMRRTFERADRLAMAMDARCFTGKRTDPGFSLTAKDWTALLAVICLCFVVVLI